MPGEVTSAADRAAAAERAVLGAYRRRVALLPGTALGRRRPVRGRPFARRPLDYWWQAHLLDCLVDAQGRAPAPGRRRLIGRVVRSVWLANGGWCNDFHDDMAWFALALGRAAEVTGVDHARARRALRSHLRNERRPDGLLTWRCHDAFVNAPANGPAAILLAREGDVGGAVTVVRWLTTTLTDPATGLVLDGIQADGHVETAVYTYNQGTTLGALVELAGLDPRGGWAARAGRLVDTVGDRLAPGGVLTGRGGDDGGLFAGICARYLALAAHRLDLPEAARLVLRSADAAWAGRDPETGRFAADWSRPAGTDPVDDNLSVQLSAWMLLEAAATLAAGDR